MKKQSVRIIGGKYRGRKLFFPDILGLRPTTDRVRETVFNWLMHDIKDACVLDAFAGSGALGLEALSRGAANVVMVEADRQAASSIQQHIKEWEALNATVLCQDVLRFLQQTEQVFDVVFLDPPFAKSLLQPALDCLLERKLITSNTLIYIETPSKQDFDHPGYITEKQKKAGQVMYRMVRQINSTP